MKQKQNKNERITQIGTQTTGTQTETQLLGTQIIKQTRTWHKLIDYIKSPKDQGAQAPIIIDFNTIIISETMTHNIA